MATARQKEYNASSIVALTDLEGIRKNRNIYTGDDNKTAVWLCIREIYQNAYDELIAAKVKDAHLCIARHESGFYVYDNGRGIPVEKHPTEKISALELVFTKLNAGAKGEENSYSDSKNIIGVHGMGAAVSNALSKSFSAYTYRGGWHCYRSVGGKSVPGISKRSPKDDIDPEILKVMFGNKIPSRGTFIFVQPDYSIFEAETIDSQTLVNYLEFNSLFVPGIKMEFFDLTGTQDYIFHNKTKKDCQAAVKKIIMAGLKPADIKSDMFMHSSDDVEVAFCITGKVEKRIDTFVCASPTIERGTHWQGLCNAVEIAIAPYVKKKQVFDIEYFLDGFCGFLNFNISPPSFSGQAKQKLKSKAATKTVTDALQIPLNEFFKKHARVVREQIDYAVRIKTQKDKLDSERGIEKELASITSKSLPYSLTSCPYAKPKDRELYLLEGQSAATPAKTARDNKYQEVLPIDGKITNVYRSAKLALNSEAVQDILRSIGYDRNDPNMIKSRIQNKIIILADSDSDGPLHGQTRVKTLDGSNPEIKDLYNRLKKGETIHAWGYDEKNEYRPSMIKDAIKVLTKEYYKLTLDDGTILRMTGDHRQSVYGRNGIEYIRARHLKIGMSIPAAYIANRHSDPTSGRTENYPTLCRYYKATNFGPNVAKIIESRGQVYKRDIYGTPMCADRPLHHIAFAHFYPDEWAQWQEANEKSTLQADLLNIDHINRDSFNNEHYNLQLLTLPNHMKKDGSITITNYNKSDGHRDTVRKLNANADQKYLQIVGKCAKYYAKLLNTYNKITPELWDSNIKRSPGAPKFDSDLLFDIWPDVVTAYKTKYKNTDLKLRSQRAVRRSERIAVENRNSQWAFNTIEELRKKQLPITKEGVATLKASRKGTGERTIGWKFIQPVLQQVQPNHKIVKIEKIRLKIPQEFYCLRTETGNFYIEDRNGNGLLTGNCHIRILLIGLLWRFFPEAFRRKMVYYADTPIYSLRNDNGPTLFGDTIPDLKREAERTKVKFLASNVTRAKGWAEVSAAHLRHIAFDVNSRKLVNIPPLDEASDEDKAAFFGIIQNPKADYRAQCVGLPVDALTGESDTDEDRAETD